MLRGTFADDLRRRFSNSLSSLSALIRLADTMVVYSFYVFDRHGDFLYMLSKLCLELTSLTSRVHIQEEVDTAT